MRPICKCKSNAFFILTFCVRTNSVGKSATVVRFVQDFFISKYDPTIEDSFRKSVDLGTSHEMLEILDTAGTEQFIALRDLYYRNGDGFVLVCDATNRFTFTELKSIVDGIQRTKNGEAIISLFVNKCDIVETEPDRLAVTDNDIADFCEENGIAASFKISAKTGHNVDSAFLDLAVRVRNVVQPHKSKKDSKKRRHVPNCLIL